MDSQDKEQKGYRAAGRTQRDQANEQEGLHYEVPVRPAGKIFAANGDRIDQGKGEAQADKSQAGPQEGEAAPFGVQLI